MDEQTCQFGPLTITYDARVLTPRPWTLLQSEWAAELSPQLSPGPILELCAGAGQIGLVAARLTGRALVQVERDPVAAAFAHRNARAAGVADYEIRVAPMDASLSADETFPLILADPPYLPTADVERYPQDPRTAVDGGADGMDVVHQCVAVAAAHLAPDGVLLLQVRGEQQARNLRVVETRAHDDERAVVLLSTNEIERDVIG